MNGSRSDAVAVIGAGSIGVAFAIVFARHGISVRVYDPAQDALRRGRADLDDRLTGLARRDLLPDTVEAVTTRVEFTGDLATAVTGVALVQECAPERLELKHEVLTQVAALAPADAVLASSTSAIVPSDLSVRLPDPVAARVLVGHPGNPPYLLPVIEVVASNRTAPEAVERAQKLYRAAGLRPVLVRREIEGFVFNRLQGAVLREAYALLRDGVASVDDIDEVMRSGLGRRWSVIGPFETADLNVRGGLESHAARMGCAYQRMGEQRGQSDPWAPELVATASAARRALLDLADWDERVRWRDERLMDLTPLWEAGLTKHE